MKPVHHPGENNYRGEERKAGVAWGRGGGRGEGVEKRGGEGDEDKTLNNSSV